VLKADTGVAASFGWSVPSSATALIATGTVLWWHDTIWLVDTVGARYIRACSRSRLSLTLFSVKVVAPKPIRKVPAALFEN
jgi:hypothetical protein